MAKKEKNVAASAAEAARAQSVMKMNEWIEQIDMVERQSVGTWYEIPRGYEHWHFVRCGLQNSDRAQALAASLKRMGYQPAPKGVRCVGFEEDGEYGLYLCVPEEVWNMIRARKYNARKSLDDQIKTQMTAQLGGLNFGPGSSIEVVGKTTSGSAGDIADTLRSGS